MGRSGVVCTLERGQKGCRPIARRPRWRLSVEDPVSQIRSESGFLKQRAVQLRREATLAETLVWDQLKARRLGGLRFRRQHVLHGYIIDFYCHEGRLCIELDGAPHLDPGQKSKDEHRDADLVIRGYTVLRVMNEEALHDLNAFRERVREAAFNPQRVPPL